MIAIADRRNVSAVTRKGCPGTGQPLAFLLDSNENRDSTTALRLQFLVKRFGLDERRSALIAAFAFEGGIA